jgi:hypothetical protein
MQLFGSRDDDNILERSIAMVRQGFDGNPFGSDQATVAERREGWIGAFTQRRLDLRLSNLETSHLFGGWT